MSVLCDVFIRDISSNRISCVDTLDKSGASHAPSYLNGESMDLPDAFITVGPVVRVGLLVDGAEEVPSNGVDGVFNDGAG